jgi:hypothetical protein
MYHTNIMIQTVLKFTEEALLLIQATGPYTWEAKSTKFLLV